MKKKKKTKKLKMPTDLIKKQEAELREQAANLYLMQQKIQDQQQTIEAQKKTNVMLMNRIVNPPVVMADKEEVKTGLWNDKQKQQSEMLPLAASMIFLSACWLGFGLLIGWKFL